MANFWQKVKSYFVKPKPDVIYDTTSNIARSPGSSYVESAPKGTTFVTTPKESTATAEKVFTKGSSSGGGGGGSGGSTSTPSKPVSNSQVQQPRTTTKPGDASNLFIGGIKSTDRGYGIPRETGVLTVTSAEAKTIPKKYTYWEVQSSNNLKGAVESTTEGTFAGQTSQAMSPIKFFGLEFGSTGTRESNIANIKTGQLLSGAAIEFERESRSEIARFNQGYESFIGRPGVEVGEDKVTLTPKYFEGLPSYKNYAKMFDDGGYISPSTSKQALLYAKQEFVSLPTGLRIQLQAGEIGVGVGRIGSGLVEMGANYFGKFGTQTIDLEKTKTNKVLGVTTGFSNDFSFSEKTSPTSSVGRLLSAPTVSSKYETGVIPIIGLEYPKEKPTKWLGELFTQRPASSIPLVATTGMAAVAVSSGVESYFVERATGTSRLGAFTSVVGELSPLKIRGGIMGVDIKVGKTQQAGKGIIAKDVGVLNDNVRLLKLGGSSVSYTPSNVEYTSLRFKGIEGADISRNVLKLSEFKKFAIQDNLFALQQGTEGYAKLSGKGKMKVLTYKDTLVGLDKYTLGTTKQVVKSIDLFEGGGNVRLSDFGYIKDSTGKGFTFPKTSVKITQTFNQMFLTGEGGTIQKPILKVSQFGASGKSKVEEYGYVSPKGVNYGRSEFLIRPIERITYTAPYELTSGKIVSPGLKFEGKSITGKGISGRPSKVSGTSIGIEKLKIVTESGELSYGEVISKSVTGGRTSIVNYDTLAVSPKDVMKIGYESGAKFEPLKGIKSTRVGGKPIYSQQMQVNQVQGSLAAPLFSPSKPTITMPKVSLQGSSSVYAGLGIYEKTGTQMINGVLVNPLEFKSTRTIQPTNFNYLGTTKGFSSDIYSKNGVLIGNLIEPQIYQRTRYITGITPSLFPLQKQMVETQQEQKLWSKPLSNQFISQPTTYNFGFNYETPFGFPLPLVFPSGTYQGRKGRVKATRKTKRTPSFGAVWKLSELGIKQPKFSTALEETGLFERAYIKPIELPNL